MKKFVSLTLFGFLLSGIVGCSNVSKRVSDESSDIVRPILNVMKLSSGLDEDDHSYVVFNYTISPSNASDKSIITTLSWNDEDAEDIEEDYPIDEYITCDVDESVSTITLTCLQAFFYQANLNVRSASNLECYVNIPLDYESRLVDFSWDELEKTSSYIFSAGVTKQPWWIDTADSISVTDSAITVECDYSITAGMSGSKKMFNFPFTSYKNNAAVYSFGSVDSQHETISASLDIDSVSLTAYGSVSTSWPDKVIELFEDDILPNVWEYSFMTLSSFKNYVSVWAAETLSGAESADLHNNMFLLTFDADVTFSASNGVSSTRTFSFEYKISGNSFDIPVTSLAVNGSSYIF